MGDIKKQNKFYNLMLRSDGAVSVVVVILGFLFATVLVACVGRNPANLYRSILHAALGMYQDRRGDWHWQARYIGEWFNYSIPFILCGFSMAFAARSGLFNIGGEGQYIMGLTVAQVVGVLGPQIPVIHWLFAIALAIIAGSIWGGIVGFLKARFEVSEVVATIMLNYTALYLSRIIIMPIPGTNTSRTVDYPATALLRAGFLEKLTNGSPLNMGLFMAAAAVFVYWFLMEKTNLGFALRATGFNKESARASGIPVVMSVVISMAVSGAFAGLAGGAVALGSFKYGRVISGMDNYGFTGIAVALVGNNRAAGVTLAGLLFGLLTASQTIMQANQIPKEITFIIQGVIVVFIAIREGFRIFIKWRMRRADSGRQSVTGTARA
ncbi:MAG: guanosine ABC transporter permease NupP [Treponemataceae bacterium]|nr:MAG: guanosine ABC transporter permease NupP [Treponemataceae bacterium]